MDQLANVTEISIDHPMDPARVIDLSSFKTPPAAALPTQPNSSISVCAKKILSSRTCKIVHVQAPLCLSIMVKNPMITFAYYAILENTYKKIVATSVHSCVKRVMGQNYPV